MRTSKPNFGTRPLRFTPYAWAKFHWLCHRGPSEIGAFGISRPDDLLLIEDIALIKQQASIAGVAFDDDAIADFFDQQVDEARHPSTFARIWLHTHPGDSPQPSSVDEKTFARSFSSCDWAVMAILARGGKTYARLRFTTGPGGSMLLPVEVDFTQPFAGSSHPSWDQVYTRQITIINERLPMLLDDEEIMPLVDDDEWWDDLQLDTPWDATWQED